MIVGSGFVATRTSAHPSEQPKRSSLQWRMLAQSQKTMSDRWIIYVVLGRASRARTSEPRLTEEQTVMLYGVLAMIAVCVLIDLALTSR